MLYIRPFLPSRTVSFIRDPSLIQGPPVMSSPPYSHSFLSILSLWLTLSLVVRGDDFSRLFPTNCPPFTCPSNQLPVPKSPVLYRSSGCSSLVNNNNKNNPLASALASSSLPFINTPPQLEPCCAVLHACYQTCGIAKDTCDADFKICAEGACLAGGGGGNGGTEEEVGEKDDHRCQTQAGTVDVMIKIAGCPKFEQAQKKACECWQADHHDKIEKRRIAALSAFYNKAAPEKLNKVYELISKASTPSKMAKLMYKLVKKYPQVIKVGLDPHANKLHDLLKNFNAKESKANENDIAAETSQTENLIEEDQEIVVNLDQDEEELNQARPDEDQKEL